MKVTLSRTESFGGRIQVPGDKSISHRSLILGALAEGRTEITGLLESEDVLSTERCLKQLGVRISHVLTNDGQALTIVEGCGLAGFQTPSAPLDCGNSGTTMRLLMGVLAGSRVTATLTGDQSLVRRPMERVAQPLRQMGAEIELSPGGLAPLTVIGKKLHGTPIHLKIASAQIKTAVILAALSAEGATTLTGEIQSRDHTERMLKYFGAQVDYSSNSITVQGSQNLHATQVKVPGDPSTAAFWIAAACLVPAGEVEIETISLNPTRIGFLRVLQKMGANLEFKVTSEVPEPVGTVIARSSRLRGVKIPAADIPSLIDELPLLAVLASQADGITEVEGAEELRVKETDRIDAITTGLRAMGCTIEVRSDGFRIEGPQKLQGAGVQSFHDHRIAMALSIAALVAEGRTEVENAECVAISYPQFYATFNLLRSPK